MELFPPLHLQFEQSFSYTPAYCSDRPLGSRVCRIFWSSLGIGSDTRWDQNPLVSGRALSLWGRRALASQAARGRAVSNVTIHNSGFTDGSDDEARLSFCLRAAWISASAHRCKPYPGARVTQQTLKILHAYPHHSASYNMLIFRVC